MRFEQPEFLLLGLLIPPLVYLGWRALQMTDRLRRAVILTCRSLLLLLVITMLAGPHLVQRHDEVTVIGLVDVSGSVKRFADLPDIEDLDIRSNIEYMRWWFREATGVRAPNDRFGLIAFDGRAVAISAPMRSDYVDDNLDISLREGTSIAEAIRLGLAMFPPDTNKRLVLMSDGNETFGDSLEVARQLAATPDGRASIPIDVVPIEYNVDRDARVVRVEAPQTAQPDQTVSVRIVMEATQPMTGRLSLLREGVPVDINPDEAGNARPVELPAGRSVHRAAVRLGDTPIHRFEAVFEPDNPAMDSVPENNRGMAFTSTPSRGQVMVVTPDGRDSLLARTLQQAEIDTRLASPNQLPDEPLSLQAYDLIILNNVPSYVFSRRQHEVLGNYVDEYGGGLIMVGGRQSFGAGGWNNTDLAQVMPVLLDPPREMRRPTSAMSLVIDNSGSMNRGVAGARATQQEIANEAAAMAIESLHADTYVGLVVFNHSPDTRIPLQRNENPRAFADEIRSIMAGGGTRIEPALRSAYEELRKVPDIENRHIVLLTDGQSQDPTIREFVRQLAAENITVTTIGIGDEHAIDRPLLEWIAETTGGTFYHARDPRRLPRVMSESVQVLNKPLIKDDPFRPDVRGTGSALTAGMSQAPPLGGLVITAPREDPLVSLDMIHPDGEPLLAHWQAGLGRVAAFTSDAEGDWSDQWAQWGGYSAFWTQLARSMSRAPMPRNAELTTAIRDGELHVGLEMFDEDDEDISFTQVSGRIYTPDGDPTDVRLREVAPGRYEATVPAFASGNYIVALTPRRAGRPMSPVIGGVSHSTGPEYRSYTSNTDLLRQISTVTGGRELVLDRPEAAELYDRADMSPVVASRPAWRNFLWLAVLFLLLDVAARRIAWNTDQLRAAVATATGRIATREARSRQAAATLGSLRNVAGRRTRRAEAASADQSTAPATNGRPAPAAVKQRAQHEAQPSQPPASRSQSGDASSTPSPQPAPDQRAQPAPAAARDDDDGDASNSGSTDTTRGLLAAKRRTRRKFEEGE